MEKLSGMMFTGGNAVDLLANGRTTFETMLYLKATGKS